MKKKMMAFAVTLVMVLTLLPAGALAAEDVLPEDEGNAAVLNGGAALVAEDALSEDEGTAAAPNSDVALAAEGDSAENPITITADTSVLENGKYYKLAGDVTLTSQIVVNNGVATYIELASGTLTAPAGKYAISVKTGGTLTINGTNGTVAGSAYGALTNDGGTVTINGGTFTSGWRITVKNQDGTSNAQGDMTINGGTFTCTANPMDQAVQNFCKLVINGGTFQGKVVTWQEVGTGYSDFGDTTIKAGTFEQDVLVALSTNDNGSGDAARMPKLTVEGTAGSEPDFKGDVGFFEGNEASEGAKPAAQANGKVIIKNANVEGDVYNGSKGTIEIEDSTIKGAVTNKANGDGGAAGDGMVSIKNSILDSADSVDESVGLVSGCKDTSGTEIENKFAANTNLKAEKNGTYGSSFAQMWDVRVSGLQSDKYYLIRIANAGISTDPDGDSFMIALENPGPAFYTVTCKPGQFVDVFELEDKPASWEGTIPTLTEIEYAVPGANG